MMKVLSIVLNNFKNDTRVLKECMSLKNEGYMVSVVALHEEPFEEYEVVKGIPIHRIKLKTRAWSKAKLIQLIKFFELLYKIEKIFTEVDIYHCNDLDTLPIGVILKWLKKRKIRVVYDTHEYQIELVGLKPWEKKIRKFVESFFIRYADNIITVSESIANEYVRLYKVKKPTLVLNCPPFKYIRSKKFFEDKFSISKDQTIILYQGGLGKGRGIEYLLEVFEKLPNTKVLVLMGDGPLKKLVIEYTQKCQNIFYQSQVNLNVLLSYTSSADFGILLYENTCLNHYFCLPNKIFEYLMAGLPVIVSNLFEIKRLVEKYQVGYVVDVNNPDSTFFTIDNINKADKYKFINNIKKLKTIYNWENQEVELLKLYNRPYE